MDPTNYLDKNGKLFKGKFYTSQKNDYLTNYSKFYSNSNKNSVISDSSISHNSNRIDFKKLTVYNVLPSAQRLNQVNMISNENDNFIKNVKRSMSLDTIEGLIQKTKNI